MLGIPHQTTILLQLFVLMSFAFFDWLIPFGACFYQWCCCEIEPILMVFYWDKHLKFVI